MEMRPSADHSHFRHVSESATLRPSGNSPLEISEPRAFSFAILPGGLNDD
jgi:hypothetical protein